MNFNRLYLKFFTRHNMKRQLVTVFICAILIPVLLVGGVICVLSCRQMIRSFESLSKSKAMQIRSTTVTNSIYLHSMYESVANNQELKELLCGGSASLDVDQAVSDQTDFFDGILKNTASLTSIQLYVPSKLMEDIPDNPYLSPITEEIEDTSWYQRALSTSGNFWMSNTRLGQADISYWELHYYCHIPLPAKHTYAILVMSVSNDYIRNLINGGDYEIYLSVNDDPVFFSTDRKYPGNPFPISLTDENINSQTTFFDLSGTKAIGSFQDLKLFNSSDTLHVFVSDTNAVPSILRLALIFGLIVLFALLIPAIIIWLYAGYFSARVNTLRLAMYKVSKNDYEIVDTIQGDDELTAAFRDLKTMVTKLQEAQAQIYQAQIREQMISNEQQKMELKLLASQINPHFLYNTLETIRMKAFAEGNREVANAIKLLGKSMRYVLGNTKTTSTTLDKEMDYISTYLAIQKMRFGSRLNYHIRIDEGMDLSRYQILPLLIQPIVENAISHGIEDTGEEGHLILRLSRSADAALLTADIFDNGAGMTPETLEEVNRHLTVPRSDSEHGIGLYNINNRVKLFYGKEYGITIKSRFHIGTLVTLTIPLCNLTEEDS